MQPTVLLFTFSLFCFLCCSSSFVIESPHILYDSQTDILHLELVASGYAEVIEREVHNNKDVFLCLALDDEPRICHLNVETTHKLSYKSPNSYMDDIPKVKIVRVRANLCFQEDLCFTKWDGKLLAFDSIYGRLDYHYSESRKPNSIDEHIPLLRHFASRSSTILELGVKNGISSWAFLKGLSEINNMYNSSTITQKSLVSCDLVPMLFFIQEVSFVAKSVGIEYNFYNMNDLELTFPAGVTFDITFIDTWHVFWQLKRELAKFAPITNNWIIMHDTEIDGEYGENFRYPQNITEVMLNTPGELPNEAEINKGLRFAIDEFLQENEDEWELEFILRNNNGLTVLRRKARM